MKKVAAVVAVVVLALTLCQPVSAAPTQGITMAAQHTSSVSLLDRLLGLFGAIWVGHGGANDGAVWTCPGGGRC
jgi:hypothetical protein